MRECVAMTQPSDAPPSYNVPRGRCPWCGYVSTFTHTSSAALSPKAGSGTGPAQNAEFRTHVLSCQGCLRGTVTIEEGKPGVPGSDPVYWWPTPAIDFYATPNIPAPILDSFQEAGRCLSVNAPNACVAMLRNCLAAVVEDKGSAAAIAKKDLYGRIEQMVTDGALFADFGEWAHHIRQNGNAGAHQEKFAPIGKEQAEELLRFTRELIKFLYVQPYQRAEARPPQKKA